jgi:subfamily B ATP-binding cassette protein MsbA
VLFGVANYALIGPVLGVLFEPSNLAGNVIKPQAEWSLDYVEAIFSYYLSDIINQNGPMKGLIFVCLMLVLATLFSNICRYLSQRILVSMKTKLMMNLRSALFAKISTLHIGYFNNQRKGDILSSISNDVNEIQNTIASSFHVIFREPLLVIGFLSMLFYMSPTLTVISLIAIPLSGLVISKITHKLRRGAVITQTLMGQIISRFEEAISGSRIIKAFNATDYVNEQFQIDNSEHKRISQSISNRQELASPMSEFLGISVAVIVLFFGGWLNYRGELGMTWTSFVVYIGFYWRVLEPVKAIASSIAAIQRGLVSANRVFSILDVEDEIKSADNPIPLRDFKDKIEFKNVSFAYEQEPVLKDINITLKKGKMIAVVGPSGAGKSTMADLIPRFWDVTSGKIALDGHDIREYSLDDLTSLIGFVTQESILFNDTVFNNISFGMKGVSREAVINAARIANADEFISQMESGYDTNIGDRGSKLSGGQRQRVAIARAVLKNPPILILDEATSALDTESEKLVQEALSNLMANRTSLVIAHRLSTIQHADEIVVLQNGFICERGTHQELLERGGLYSNLCKMQSFA